MDHAQKRYSSANSSIENYWSSAGMLAFVPKLEEHATKMDFDQNLDRVWIRAFIASDTAHTSHALSYPNQGITQGRPNVSMS